MVPTTKFAARLSVCSTTLSREKDAILQDKEKAKHKGLAFSGAAKMAAGTSHVRKIYLRLGVVATENT